MKQIIETYAFNKEFKVFGNIEAVIRWGQGPTKWYDVEATGHRLVPK